MPDPVYWPDQLATITQAYRRNFSHLNADELNWKPHASTWSIGQIIEHVIKVNETYFPIFDQLHGGKYKTGWTARLPFMAHFFGSFILKSMLPETKKKTPTFPLWEPTKSEVDADIFGQFERHQNKLGEEMERCRPFLESGTVIASPANRLIVYKLEKAFEIILAHERRHLLQGQEVLAVMREP